MVAVVAPEDTDRALAVLTARHLNCWVLGSIKKSHAIKTGEHTKHSKTGVAELMGEHPRF